MKVALCSISSRKECLLKTLKSLLNQTKPCEIHLFLSEEPHLLDKGFPNKEISDELRSLPIQIHWVPNWGSYRKNLAAFKEFPEDVFFAVDDDEEFDPGLMEFLEKNYTGGVLALRASYYNDQPYRKWKDVKEPLESVHVFHKGNGGVVYDSKLFQDEKFLNSEAFLRLCGTNDDIWVNLWRIHKNIPAKVIPKEHKPLPQEERLWFLNNKTNDTLIKNVNDYFKGLS